MVQNTTARTSICTLIAIAALSASAFLNVAHADSRKSTSTSLARITRTLAKLNQGLNGLSSQIANQKPTVVTVPAPNEPQVTPSQGPIGKNNAGSSYMSFDFYEGRTAEAISYHNESGIGVVFHIREQGVTGFAQEYKLNFPFADRTPEQRLADTFMIQTCLTHFHRAADAPTGGTFFINPNKDSKIGLLCASVVNK